MQDMAFPRVQFSNFFSGGTCPWTPYLIRAFGANSPLVSLITLCLMFSYKKIHAKTIRIPNLNETEVWTPKNTKRDYRNVAPEKIIKSIGDDQKSSWIMNLEENSCRNHESLRQKRQESWISRFKWFRFYPRDQLILVNAPLPYLTQYIASFQLQCYVFFILCHKLN